MSKPLLRLGGGSRRGSGEGRAARTGAAVPSCSAGPLLSRSIPPFSYLLPAGRSPEGTEQNRVRNKLKRLIAKRPPLQSLQERGLLRGEGGQAGWRPCSVSCFRVWRARLHFRNGHQPVSWMKKLK